MKNFILAALFLLFFPAELNAQSGQAEKTPAAATTFIDKVDAGSNQMRDRLIEAFNVLGKSCSVLEGGPF